MTKPPEIQSPVLSGLLADPTRRAIYEHVSGAGKPVTVDDISGSFGVHRNAAKHHLDKLLEAGLLRADYRRVNGKQGPGAGRPSKLYSPSDVEVAFSLPERHYDLLASLLLQALVSGDQLDEVGRTFGASMAADVSSETGFSGLDCAQEVLDRLGFHPTLTSLDGHLTITTTNCPFGKVALEAPNREVCRLDRAIIRGVLESFWSGEVTVTEHTSKAAGSENCVREAAGTAI